MVVWKEQISPACVYLITSVIVISAAVQIANMLVAAKADDVCILDVSSQCSFTEHMVLATGRSHRHIQAAAAAVAYQVSLPCMSQVTRCSRLYATSIVPYQPNAVHCFKLRY